MENEHEFQIPEMWLTAFNPEIRAAAVNGLIIDPGHGGLDPGAAANGIIEEHYVLAVSLYQYKRYQELGVPVKITRTSDISLPPEIRTAIVRNSGMKHCISNHVNAGGGDGAEFIHSKFSSSRLGDIYKEEFAKEGQNTRRVFTRTLNSGQDYYFMHRETGAVETLIAEHGFLDDRTGKDIKLLKEKLLQLAEAGVRAYCRYAGFKYTAPISKVAADIALFKVQAGAFKDLDGAQKRVLELKKVGIESYVLKVGSLYKVQAGAFGKIEGAKARVELIKKAGFEAFYIKE